MEKKKPGILEELGDTVEIPEEVRKQLDQAQNLTEEQLQALIKKKEQEKRPQEKPEVHMLMGLQKNLFCDAAFQSMAIAMIGTVFTRNPELNNPELFVNHDFSAKDNDSWQKYSFGNKVVYKTDLVNMPRRMEECIAHMTEDIKNLIETRKIVMGTLRTYAHYRPETAGPNFSITLVWVEEE